jgi:hypothetical protein
MEDAVAQCRAAGDRAGGTGLIGRDGGGGGAPGSIGRLDHWVQIIYLFPSP